MDQSPSEAFKIALFLNNKYRLTEGIQTVMQELLGALVNTILTLERKGNLR